VPARFHRPNKIVGIGIGIGFDEESRHLRAVAVIVRTPDDPRGSACPSVLTGASLAASVESIERTVMPRVV
jgi:hypothetical protein